MGSKYLPRRYLSRRSWECSIEDTYNHYYKYVTTLVPKSPTPMMIQFVILVNCYMYLLLLNIYVVPIQHQSRCYLNISPDITKFTISMKHNYLVLYSYRCAIICKILFENCSYFVSFNLALLLHGCRSPESISLRLPYHKGVSCQILKELKG